MPGIALMAIDPGGKTGVAAGFFNPECASVHDAVMRARKKNVLHAWTLSGSTIDQAACLAAMWHEFELHALVELGCKRENVKLVIEDFQLRQRNADLAPVEVTYGLLAHMRAEKTDHAVRVANRQLLDLTCVREEKTDHGKPLQNRQVVLNGDVAWEPGDWLVWNSPSTAMTSVTNERLKRWGAWVVGSDHARDAMRHVLTQLDRML